MDWEIVLKGRVDEHGHIDIEEKVDLPAGEITLIVKRPAISITLAEAKRLMLEEPEERELTPEQLAEYHRLNQQFLALASDDLDLPPDYADEIDHYLYGTPKRNVSKDQD